MGLLINAAAELKYWLIQSCLAEEEDYYTCAALW